MVLGTGVGKQTNGIEQKALNQTPTYTDSTF